MLFFAGMRSLAGSTQPIIWCNQTTGKWAENRRRTKQQDRKVSRKKGEEQMFWRTRHVSRHLWPKAPFNPHNVSIQINSIEIRSLMINLTQLHCSLREHFPTNFPQKCSPQWPQNTLSSKYLRRRLCNIPINACISSTEGEVLRTDNCPWSSARFRFNLKVKVNMRESESGISPGTTRLVAILSESECENESVWKGEFESGMSWILRRIYCKDRKFIYRPANFESIMSLLRIYC